MKGSSSKDWHCYRYSKAYRSGEKQKQKQNQINSRTTDGILRRASVVSRAVKPPSLAVAVTVVLLAAAAGAAETEAGESFRGGVVKGTLSATNVSVSWTDAVSSIQEVGGREQRRPSCYFAAVAVGCA